PQNLNASGYSAIAPKDKNGNEMTAFGYSQAGGTLNIFPGYVYWEISGFPNNFSGPPNPFLIFQTANFASAGGFNNHPRIELPGDAHADLNFWAVTSDMGVLKKRFTLAGDTGELGIGDRVGDQRSIFAASGYPLTLITTAGKGLRTVKVGVKKLDQWIDDGGLQIWYRFQDSDAGGSVFPLSLSLDGTANAKVGGNMLVTFWTYAS